MHDLCKAVLILIVTKVQVSSQRVKEAARCMHIRASKADCVYKGEFKLSEDQVLILCFFEDSFCLTHR